MYNRREIYFERELAFVSTRQDKMANYFAKQYPAEAGFASRYVRAFPAQAGALELDSSAVIDPHAERLIQAFAMLSGRVHQKIDDEFPQLTEAIVGLFYPHLLLPVPSMTIAKLSANEDAEAAAGVHVPKNSHLMSHPVSHPPTPCQWRTGYPVDLWPVEVSEATMQPYAYFSDLPLPKDTQAVLRLRLACKGNHQFTDLPLEKLRFYLNADREITANLFELLFNDALGVCFRDPDRPDKIISLDAHESLHQVGFELDEGLLTFPVESFVGYRLLTEFFSFPHKFWFVDLAGWEAVRQNGFGRNLEVFVFLKRMSDQVARAVDVPVFQLGCTPIINLFSKIAEPISLSHTRFEYQVVPDRNRARNGIEIYTVDKLSTFNPNDGAIDDFKPFYGFAWNENSDAHRAFWFASRRQSAQEAARTQDVHVVLVDRDFDPHVAAEKSVNVHVTCSNGELPHQFFREGSPLFLRRHFQPFAGTIQMVRTPTEAKRPALGSGTFWRWLSQTVLGHVAFSDKEEGIDALKETLLLCSATRPFFENKSQEAIISQLIEGVTALESRRVTRPVVRQQRIGTCQGIEFTVELDRRKYVGTGAYFFACILERFLGLYAHVNSFSQLQVRTAQGKGYLKKWPPRAVDLPLT